MLLAKNIDGIPFSFAEPIGVPIPSPLQPKPPPLSGVRTSCVRTCVVGLSAKKKKKNVVRCRNPFECSSSRSRSDKISEVPATGGRGCTSQFRLRRKLLRVRTPNIRTHATFAFSRGIDRFCSIEAFLLSWPNREEGEASTDRLHLQAQGT